ncbi:hypothetical protein [Enterococcus sp. N249-2]
MKPVILNHNEMNEYIRFLLKTMIDKYHMDLSSFAKSIGKGRAYLYQFVIKDRNMRIDNLQLVESELIDLYAPLLELDLQINKLYIDDLFKRGNYEELKNKQEKLDI